MLTWRTGELDLPSSYWRLRMRSTAAQAASASCPRLHVVNPKHIALHVDDNSKDVVTQKGKGSTTRALKEVDETLDRKVMG